MTTPSMNETSSQPTPRAEDVARVWELMEKINICMFATKDGDLIRARPMGVTPRENEHAIYLLTDTEGHKDTEVQADENVCLSFSKHGDGNYLVVTGTARILNDRALIRDLWSPAAEAFWEGPDDPRVRAIEVTPRDAQMWEGPGGIVATVMMVAAAVIGKEPDVGEQKKVPLN